MEITSKNIIKMTVCTLLAVSSITMVGCKRKRRENTKNSRMLASNAAPEIGALALSGALDVNALNDSLDEEDEK